MIQVKKGDNIKIEAQGIIVEGKVYSAQRYNPEGWYIEITEANVPGGYSYWKQNQDGGRIVEINGTAVNEWVRNNCRTVVINGIYKHYCAKCERSEYEHLELREEGYYTKTITIICKCGTEYSYVS